MTRKCSSYMGRFDVIVIVFVATRHRQKLDPLGVVETFVVHWRVTNGSQARFHQAVDMPRTGSLQLLFRSIVCFRVSNHLL